MSKEEWVVAVQLRATRTTKKWANSRSPNHTRKKPICVSRCSSNPLVAISVEEPFDCLVGKKTRKRARKLRADILCEGPLSRIAALRRQRELTEDLRAEGHLVYDKPAVRNRTVYVVELRPDVYAKAPAERRGKSGAQCVYVGQTSKHPEDRFVDHLADHKAGRGWVRDYGVSLINELQEGLFYHDDALTREAELANELLVKGWTVLGGH